ncbi:TetR/AcrR family transcriptional regulator [Acidicapsa dinghuensis]|uniref:TetR/AcrR family transcriptional regulator n=1 Tax=Acidicapsa dinghuensis TaxID=2218256 RepID=A0ABW1ENS5_9BACT|nr:TetR/AcrR family transcriptional regulator [Acidicapsa dinghuensis]
MTNSKTISTNSSRAEQTRAAILKAAIREFGAHGLSGARIDAIAQAASANKALLYYYFKNKEGLYSAAIESVSAEVVHNALAALDPKYSPGERLLRCALNHFDRILTKHEFQSLLQQEMVRVQRNEHHGETAFFQSTFRPLMERLLSAVEEGVRAGELCKAEPMQVVYAIFGTNVFYFLSAPMVATALGIEPFHPQALEARRRGAVQLWGNALFVDRAHGAKLVQKVLRQMPMPEVKDFQLRRKFA